MLNKKSRVKKVGGVAKMAGLASALLFTAVTAQAIPLNYEFQGELVTDNVWNAGADQLDTWYAPHSTNGTSPAAYSFSNGNAVLDHANRNQYRSLLIAWELPSVGIYDYVVSTLYSNYSNQLNYWQVFAASEGTAFNLRSQTWTTVPNGALRLDRQYALDDGSENGVDFVDFASSFEITADDFSNFDYLVLAFTGSRGSNQVLQFGSQATSVPVAPAWALMLVPFGLLVRQHRKRAQES